MNYDDQLEDGDISTEMISLDTIIELKDKGCNFAEKGEFKQALREWNNVISKSNLEDINNIDVERKFIMSTLFELKAQVYLELDFNLKAVKEAKLAIELSPNWATAHMTLARCHREMGEVNLSMESYQNTKKIIKENHNHPLDSDIEEVLNKEMNELQVVINELEKKQQLYKKILEDSSTPAELEANKCIYHLSSRLN